MCVLNLCMRLELGGLVIVSITIMSKKGERRGADQSKVQNMVFQGLQSNSDI